MEYKGYTVRKARNTGGKAGYGHNKTLTVQVVQDIFIKKSFRFTVGMPSSYRKAIRYAKKFIDERKEK